MASRPDRSSSKRRRLTRACDMCKRKKIRCDGVEMPGNQCSNCVNSRVHCTHVDVLKNLGTAKGYVESLERRLHKLTHLVKKLLPDVDIEQELDDDEPAFEEETAATEDDGTSVFLSQAVNRTLNFAPQRQRYFGKSNALFLIQTVTSQRARYLEKQPALNPSFSLKQGEHWAARPWYNPRAKCQPQEFEFPDDDLLRALVDAYFEHENMYLPLLHRPIFERTLADKTHLHDEMFAGVLLMVCALGSRWVDDPRVFVDGVDMAGWAYFDQIALHPPPDGPVSLFEMQMYCLYIIYHQHIPTARTMWIYLGTAFRLVQDAGMHMRSPNPSNAEDELWKRVVWVLIFLDISYASIFGLQPTLHYESFDLDFPIECDDEYWDQDFIQPAGKPTFITSFVQLLKLMNVLSYVLRVLYSVRKPLHVFNGHRLPEPQILTGFDNALNEWQAALPDHLRWDPRRRDEAHFRQSAFIHITMYYVQIQVHRPYIPGPDQKKTVLPSFAICSNAALSAMRIVESQKYRGYLENLHIISYLYPAAMVLLLRAWSIPPGDVHPNATQEMKGVQICLDMLKRCQKRPNSPPTFIFWDLLSGLMTDDTSPRARSPVKPAREFTERVYALNPDQPGPPIQEVFAPQTLPPPQPPQSQSLPQLEPLPQAYPSDASYVGYSAGTVYDGTQPAYQQQYGMYYTNPGQAQTSMYEYGQYPADIPEYPPEEQLLSSQAHAPMLQHPLPRPSLPHQHSHPQTSASQDNYTMVGAGDYWQTAQPPNGNFQHGNTDYMFYGTGGG